MKKDDYITASVRWPRDLKEAIDAIAKEDGRNFSNYVIQVLRHHLAKLKGKKS